MLLRSMEIAREKSLCLFGLLTNIGDSFLQLDEVVKRTRQPALHSFCRTKGIYSTRKKFDRGVNLLPQRKKYTVQRIKEDSLEIHLKKDERSFMLSSKHIYLQHTTLLLWKCAIDITVDPSISISRNMDNDRWSIRRVQLSRYYIFSPVVWPSTFGQE